jgi:phosphoenolpyruvate carboxylase
MRAVQVFGFHLATVDLRQSSDKHEAVVPNCWPPRASSRLQALDEGARAPAAAHAERRAAHCACAAPSIRSEHAQSELAIFETAREMLARYGRHALRHYIISHTEDVSDLLEVLLLQKEAGLLRGALGRDARVNDLIVVPLFETIGDLRNARADHARVLRAAGRGGTDPALGRASRT